MNLTPPPPTTSSFEKSAIPLSLTLKPSNTLLAAVIAFHALAMAAAIKAALPLPGLGLLSLLLLASLVYNLVMLYRPCQIVWHAGNRWTIKRSATTYVHAELASVDFLSRWLVILTLKPSDTRAERLVIPFDSVEKASYRLLRVRLRIEGHRLINPTESGR